MTPPTHRKALQPPHPSERQVAKAISPPGCQRGVPIYPVRYGITDKPFDAATFPQLSAAAYPALQGGKAYGVRVLRPDCYVYLCYFKDGRMWTQHYQVTADMRFARLWWGEQDRDSDAPGTFARLDQVGAKPYLLAPEETTAVMVYVLVSDTLLTHRTLYRIETNDSGLRDKLATPVKPAGGVNQSHVFPALLLGNATAELVKTGGYGDAYRYIWSEVQPANNAPDTSRIVSAMTGELMPRKDVVPLAVALQDSVGIASELNYLCHTEAKKRDTFIAKNKHRLQSAALINNYFKQAESSPDAKTPDALKAIAKQKTLVDWKSAGTYKHDYEKELRAYDATVNTTGGDVVTWMRLLDQGKRLGTALDAFDLTCARNAQDYEIAVLNCIGAAVHTDAGLKEVTKLIEAMPDASAYWKALGAGDIQLMNRLSDFLTVTKAVFSVVDNYVERHAATAATNALAGMAQHYAATASADKVKVLMLRLRHVSERRFSITLSYTEVTQNQFLRYAMEMQGYTVLGPDLIKRWSLDMTQQPGELPGTVQIEGRERVAVWEFESVTAATAAGIPMETTGNPLLRNLQRLRNAALVKAEPLRGPAGVVFTGIGGVLAVWTMRNAIADLDQQRNATTIISALGAATGVIGSGIEITTLAWSTYAKSAGNEVLAKILLTRGFKWGTTYAGAAAAALVAMADLTRAVKAADAGNIEQERLYAASAIAGGVLALATFAGGQATLATAAGSEAGATVLGFGPWGWLIVGLVATGAVVYCSWAGGNAAYGPVETCLAHGAWGTATKHYSLDQELEAWHGLYFRPRLTTQWTPANPAGNPMRTLGPALEAAWALGSRLVPRWGDHAGTLRLRCTLPGSGAGDFEAKLRVTLNGKALQQVDATAATQAPGGFNLDLDRQYLAGRLSSDLGVERGWSFIMHSDAQVELIYLYRPDPQHLPTIALEQPDAPTPLEFKKDGAVNEGRTAPVRAPT
jgi:hypothetical protein